MTNKSKLSLTRTLALFIAFAGGWPCRGLGQEASSDLPYVFERNVRVPMRDGVQLAANLFLPKQVEAPHPAILIRTPYGKGDENFGEGRRYASDGYAVLVQDCRGKGDSEGVWDPFRYDPQDGIDTQNWVGEQSWCNGKIGTAGGSYVGWTQWASAGDATPYLKAMVPVVPFSEVFEDIMYPGGAFQLALSFGWGAAVGGVFIEPGKLDEAYEFLPLNRWSSQFEKDVFYLKNWIDHSTPGEYWKKRRLRASYQDVEVPILNIGGWYDIFSKATLDMTTRVRKEAANRMSRRNQCVIIGPWGHGVGGRTTGALDFGEQAALNLGEWQGRWFDFWLKDKDTGVEDWPDYYLFVMGENKWRSATQWPLKNTRWTPWHLRGLGGANTLNGDGSLTVEPPMNEKSDSYVYDPGNPVPTAGGNNLIGVPIGPHDQTEVEKREDVLVYTSAPLLKPLEVTGPVKMILYAASTARDTDFTAKLVDVHPDGVPYNLCDGIQRARFRDSRTAPELIEPGKVYRYEIDLWVTGNVFLEGHRVRVEISSSNFPRFDRNPNSGLPFGTDTELHPATQTVFHNAEYPSHILLPVIPR